MSNRNLISIHSIKGGPGKTTVALSTALSIAKDPNKKVCIIDLDINNPNFEYFFPINKNPKKYIEYFLDPMDEEQKEPSEYFYRLNIENYNISAAFFSSSPGTVQWVETWFRLPKPTFRALLRKFLNFVKFAMKTYDLVIIDNSPGLINLSWISLIINADMNGLVFFVTTPERYDLGKISLPLFIHNEFKECETVIILNKILTNSFEGNQEKDNIYHRLLNEKDEERSKTFLNFLLENRFVKELLKESGVIVQSYLERFVFPPKIFPIPYYPELPPLFYLGRNEDYIKSEKIEIHSNIFNDMKEILSHLNNS